MAYTKKETAIESLENGKSFRDKEFNLFRDDKEVVLRAINENVRFLYYASPELKNDKEFIIQALDNDSKAIHYASDEIKKLCKDKDPIETLEKAIKAENLSNDLEKSLSKSQASTKPKLKI